MSAAAVKVDITPSTSKWLEGYPSRRSTGMHDSIFHRIVAMDDGHTQFFLVSSDLCLFSPAVYDQFAAELKRQTGIERAQVWWTVTHTHSAPEVGPPSLLKVLQPERYTHEVEEQYTAEIEKSLVEGIKAARAQLKPAHMYVGIGYSAANINRRARDPEGKISLGLNPDGPTDRQINLVRLDTDDDTPIALIANYSMHGTALGDPNTLITGDAPGAVAAYVESKLGCPMLYINGAAGNLAPIYTVQPTFDDAHLTEFNVLLGDRILSANRRLSPAGPVQLQAGERIIRTPRRAGFGWDDTVAAYLEPHAGENGMVRVPVRYLILNDDIAIWAAPVELFCEISLNIRHRSPYEHTFYFGYANGWLGYLPTRQAYHEGGYETQTNPFTDQVEDDLTNAVVALLQGHGR